jgi:hypothetical protein
VIKYLNKEEDVLLCCNFLKIMTRKVFIAFQMWLMF